MCVHFQICAHRLLTVQALTLKFVYDSSTSASSRSLYAVIIGFR